MDNISVQIEIQYIHNILVKYISFNNSKRIIGNLIKIVVPNANFKKIFFVFYFTKHTNA